MVPNTTVLSSGNQTATSLFFCRTCPSNDSSTASGSMLCKILSRSTAFTWVRIKVGAGGAEPSGGVWKSTMICMSFRWINRASCSSAMLETMVVADPSPNSTWIFLTLPKAFLGFSGSNFNPPGLVQISAVSSPARTARMVFEVPSRNSPIEVPFSPSNAVSLPVKTWNAVLPASVTPADLNVSGIFSINVLLCSLSHGSSR